MDDHAAAAADAEAALTIAETEDDRLALGRAHSAVVAAWHWRHKRAKSAAHAQVVAQLRQSDRPGLLAVAPAVLGDALHWAGHPHESMAPLHEPVALFREIDDPRSQAIALNIRGHLAATQVVHALAGPCFGKAMSRARAMGDD